MPYVWQEECPVCNFANCDGLGVDEDDREFHRGYREAERWNKIRREFGDKVADQIILEAERGY